jgi:protein tyrosine phosphatase (PTP) superfamily phosphohydrolase (DUF442 family)
MRVTFFPILLAVLFSLVLISAKCGGLHANDHPFPNSTIFNFGWANKNIARGSQPHGNADYEGLKKFGFKTVLNLRDDALSIEPVFAKQYGLEYRRIPMSSTAAPKLESVRAALIVLRNPANFPVFLHCEGGHHRTSLIIAVYRVVVDGWDKQKAWREAKEFDYYRGFNHGAIEDWFLNEFKSEEFK